MSRKRYNVAVVGATGAVGTEMLRVLAQRRFPIKGLHLLASQNSKGRKIRFGSKIYPVEPLQAQSFDGMDVALFSAGASRSLEFAPEAVKRGAIVVDNSSAFRMAPDVPLVIPEVNSHALLQHRGIIANPNCSTIILLVALAPLHRAARIKRIIVATYQSVSGAGAKAMFQLYDETKRALRQCGVRPPRRLLKAGRGSSEFGVKPKLKGRWGLGLSPLPKQIAFNVIPQVDVFLENRYTKEEMKMVNETRKILEEPQLAVTSTCVRVPVFLAHSEAAWIQTERPLSVEQASQLLQNAPGVRLVDSPKSGTYPLPVDAGGQDKVYVGRLRQDESVANGLALWVSGDNLRKGAATNAVQIAELLIKTP
ncbi:MAG: aspartate-semialdehyde dehydrogenase [Candidatus Omnitrophica bacterium]|nr:aspartate-semialdehyde dehydrogenase [Candidatus Omnitrophota bacterium]MBI3009933.1 aspartate-semialdehyde dehydrogenase [Candidatus Omnitrophota bacterium]